MPPQHILVLMPDAARREGLLDALRSAGYQVVAAPSPLAAVEAVGPPGFDTLVLDLTMPELDQARLRQSLDPAAPAEPEPLEAAERRHIALTLRYTGGNKRRAAQLLGISRSTLLNKVRKYRLESEGGS